MTIELVPSPEALPDVLPTDRLLVNGMAIPELRKNYRHIENWRNVRAVTFVWLWTAALAYVRRALRPLGRGRASSSSWVRCTRVSRS